MITRMLFKLEFDFLAKSNGLFNPGLQDLLSGNVYFPGPDIEDNFQPINLEDEPVDMFSLWDFPGDHREEQILPQLGRKGLLNMQKETTSSDIGRVFPHGLDILFEEVYVVAGSDIFGFSKVTEELAEVS